MIRSAMVALALFAAACDDGGVDPITKITSARVLAVATEPSALSVDGALELVALTVDPDGPRLGVGSSASADDRPIDALRIRACAPWKFISDPSLDCVGDDALVLASDDQGQTPVSAAALQAAFPSPPGIDAPPDPWRAAIAAGLVLRVPIIAEIDVDGRTMVARRDLDVVDPAVVRQNPRIVEVRFDGVATTTLQAAQRYTLTVTIDPASLDDRPERSGYEQEMPGVLEQVDTQFYSPAGELADRSVSLVDPDAPVLESKSTMYTTDAPGATWLFVVATDETGGMTAMSIPLLIE